MQRRDTSTARVTLDVEARRIDVDLPAAELAARSPSLSMLAAAARPSRGWERIYVDHVMQADTGADLDVLLGASGSAAARESH